MCCGGGGGDGADRSGSEFNVAWKGVDCGASTGSAAGVCATLVSIGVSASIWILLVVAEPSFGVVAGSDRDCEVGGVLILWCAATGAVVMVALAWEAEPEGRRGRLAAWASSAEETSTCETAIAWETDRYRQLLVMTQMMLCLTSQKNSVNCTGSMRTWMMEELRIQPSYLLLVATTAGRTLGLLSDLFCWLIQEILKKYFQHVTLCSSGKN